MALKRATGDEQQTGPRERRWLEAQKQRRLAEIDRLYELHGKPLEAEHWGEFLVVSATGSVLLAPTLYDALKQGSDQFGPDNVIFKVGERVVGTIR